MNFLVLFPQQLNQWIAPLGNFLSEQWRLLTFASFLLLVTHSLLPYLWAQYKKDQLYRLMPSPVTSPLFGPILGHLELYWNALGEMKNLPLTVLFYRLDKRIVCPMQQTGESLFLYQLGPFRKYVILIKGEAAKALLSSGKHLEKAPEYVYFKDYMGETLLAERVAKWKILRKRLEPAFHLQILNLYNPAMNAHCQVLSQLIASQMDTSTGKLLLPDIRPLLDNCILDIVCETTMGVTLNSQTKGNDSPTEDATTPTSGQQFNDFILSIFDLMCERLLKPWLYAPFLYRLSGLCRRTTQCLANGRQFTNSVISQRKSTLRKELEDCATVEQATARLSNGKRLSFLDLLLVSHLKGGQSALPQSSIEDEVVEIMVGAFGTSSNTLQMALLLLGLHEDKQALLHAELDAIFGYDAERHVCLDDLRQMTYLEQCIKETLRLYPGIPIAGRTLSEDLQIDKYLVPEGTTVYINLEAIHRDPAVWTEPGKYTPERFSADSTELGPSRSFLPFSLGSRNCIGSRYAMLFLKICLATLLRQYTVRSLTTREDVQLGSLVLLKANSPISMEFTKRK